MNIKQKGFKLAGKVTWIDQISTRVIGSSRGINRVGLPSVTWWPMFLLHFTKRCLIGNNYGKFSQKSFVNFYFCTLVARGLSRALISLILHASYLLYFRRRRSLPASGRSVGLRPSPTSHESVPRQNLWYPGYYFWGITGVYLQCTVIFWCFFFLTPLLFKLGTIDNHTEGLRKMQRKQGVILTMLVFTQHSPFCIIVLGMFETRTSKTFPFFRFKSKNRKKKNWLTLKPFFPFLLLKSKNRKMEQWPQRNYEFIFPFFSRK